MSWDPNPKGLDELLQRPKTEGWSWKSLPAPPPTFSHNQFVTSHAVHPDGRTIFMTTAYRESPGLHVGTFSFDTESCVWRWHGEWALPFVGQGYFDADLDRWVGLRRDGHVCSCRVASRSRSLTRIMQLDWQVAEEKLFRRDPAEDHLSASLTLYGQQQIVTSVCKYTKELLSYVKVGFIPWSLWDSVIAHTENSEFHLRNETYSGKAVTAQHKELPKSMVNILLIILELVASLSIAMYFAISECGSVQLEHDLRRWG
ncbi:unnamed protein product [Miscanthus lutarioriparius]|uniref:Uncharacterized protein n=1 Tax=Miscanthus lutarioriparius TaxID=422564 RepID=A0A811QT25_9POAL|nr:unnamed protein product [Miscanthus lutarioriparius]